MSPILFYLFAAMTLVFAIAVVANRNPVASALSLVVSFLGLAALYVGLDAYFIAVIQVLVYADLAKIMEYYERVATPELADDCWRAGRWISLKNAVILSGVPGGIATGTESKDR